MLQQRLAVRVRQGDMFGIGRIVDEVTFVFETRYLVADHFLYIRHHLVHHITNGLHTLPRLCRKGLLVLVYRLVICFGHGCKL